MYNTETAKTNIKKFQCSNIPVADRPILYLLFEGWMDNNDLSPGWHFKLLKIPCDEWKVPVSSCGLDLKLLELLQKLDMELFELDKLPQILDKK